MAVKRPRYSKEEAARRGEAIYERDIKPHLKSEDTGKFIAEVRAGGKVRIKRLGRRRR
jgi:hypothetical protein